MKLSLMKISSVIFLIFFINSCATRPKIELKEATSNELVELTKKELGLICFSAEGRSRLAHYEQKQLVSFSAKLDRVKKNWGLGFEPPLHDEETLFISWAKGFDQVNLSGTFYEKFILKNQNPELSVSFQHKFWKSIVRLIELQNIESEFKIQDCQGQSDTKYFKAKCNILDKKSSTEIEIEKNDEEFFVISKIDDQYKMKLKAFDFQENNFKRVSLFLLKNVDQNDTASKMSMELFLKQCL